MNTLRGRKRWRGFTLLELMITVSIIAILSAVAYPSFVRQMMKSHRADAKAGLLMCAQMLERYSTQSGSYSAGADAAVGAACIGVRPSGYYQMPTGNVPTSSRAATFLIQAIPIGGQASDACGTFTYTQDGTQGVAGASLPSSDCW